MTDTPRTPNPYETAETYGDYINQLRAELAAALERAEKAEAEREALRKDAEGCTPVDIAVLRKANTDLACEVERLKTGLRFYAHGQHWINELHDDKWDTCSGEPQNWHWRDNDEESAEGVEDGGIAQVYLSGKEPDWEGEPPPEHPCEPGIKEMLSAAPSEPVAAPQESAAIDKLAKGEK